MAEISIAGKERQRLRLSVCDDVLSIKTTCRISIGIGLFLLLVGIPLLVDAYTSEAEPMKIFGVALPLWCSTLIIFSEVILGSALVVGRQIVQVDRSKGIVWSGYQLWRLWKKKKIQLANDVGFIVNIQSEVAWGSEPATYGVTAFSGDDELKIVQCNRTADAIWIAERIATFVGAPVIDATGNEIDTYDPWEREHSNRAVSDCAVSTKKQGVPEPPENAKSSWSTVRDVPALRLPPGGWRNIKDELVYWCVVGAPFAIGAAIILLLPLKNPEDEGSLLGRIAFIKLLLLIGTGVLVYVFYRVKTYHVLVFENDALCVERRWGWRWSRRRVGYKELEAVISVPSVRSFLENPPEEFSGVLSIFDHNGSVRIGGSISEKEAIWIGEVIGAVAIARKQVP